MINQHNKGEHGRIKKKKKTHRLYAAIVLGLGIAIISLTIVLLFHIQKIEIKGAEYCTEKEIQAIVQNDKLSSNALYVVGKYAIGRGETLPCLESIKVGLKRPWVLKVTIEEKPI
ncbi:MAG: FtsQ-type POTRA domain-containing protein, partial [Dorea sp.]